MPPRRRELDSAKIGAIRDAYAKGEPTRAICTRLEINLATLMHCVDGCPENGEPQLPALPRRRRQTTPAAGPGRKLRGGRTALVRRMWRTAEAQVIGIEQRLLRDGQEPVERERDARVMAMLAKTLRELVALDAGKRSATPTPMAAPEDDDPVPRNIDEFRRELARRISSFVADRTDRGLSGDADS